ncbi:hypothetical protein NE237_001641 [Protea cynaroides]|uniref:Uncharacterized protein n=1 Tax=Protea cynaroides TaxID=273540 RepID=A0A9Q0KTP5_9MAGN|nr:hypothetical protein NE237_001641 [Protea cynaroides]
MEFKLPIPQIFFRGDSLRSPAQKIRKTNLPCSSIPTSVCVRLRVRKMLCTKRQRDTAMKFRFSIDSKADKISLPSSTKEKSINVNHHIAEAGFKRKIVTIVGAGSEPQ